VPHCVASLNKRKEPDEENIYGKRGTFYDGKAFFQNDKLITCQRSKEFGS
jgi:hypothetical protein